MLVCKELRGVPLMQRHNIVVRTLVNAAMLAGVETRVEVTQPCLNEAFDEERELRPDVEMNGGMGRLLVDVVVVNPVAPSNIERRSDASVAKSVEKGEKKLTAIEQAERTKKSKYAMLAEMLNATFVPFACDVFGGMGKSAHSLVKWLIREATAVGRFDDPQEERDFRDTVYSWLSVAIQRAVAVSAFSGLARIRNRLRA